MLITEMSRRWVLLGAIAAGLAVAGASYAVNAGGPGPGLQELLGPKTARAEFVVVQNGQVHDIRFDQGRIMGYFPNRGVLVLHERDGTRQQLSFAPDAQISLNGAPAGPQDMRSGLYAIVIRDGDNPARRVILRSFLR
jgi:hypothetical protein